MPLWAGFKKFMLKLSVTKFYLLRPMLAAFIGCAFNDGK